VIAHLFVYGTLRPGQQRWPFLAPYVIDEGHDDSATGTLYDTEHGYPAARFDGRDQIYGRIYALRIDRLTEALELLDEVEGAVEDLFTRVTITTSSGRDAWAYQYSGDTQLHAIPSGNWLSADAEKPVP
jgi:gamma-glutamylcyclotransferase (GGCT)/AIG2-like uncharacterized protein YtfP